MQEAAFDGVRVVELAQWVFVPVAGALLADWGADVVRIERPEGDPYRGLATQGIGTDSGGVNLSMALANRGKRSVALDLRHERGRGRARTSCSRRPTSSSRTSARARSSGWGSTPRRSPRATPASSTPAGTATASAAPTPDSPGYDASAFWARGGIAHMLTPPDRDHPITQRGAMGDRNGAMALAFGIAAALLRASGQAPDRSSTSRCSAPRCGRCRRTCSRRSMATAPRAPSGARWSTPSSARIAPRTAGTSNSSFLEADRYWADFCRLIGREDLVDDPRFVDLAGSARQHTTRASRSSTPSSRDGRFAEWKEVLGRLDAPWAPVQTVEELLDDPQVDRQRLRRRGRDRGSADATGCRRSPCSSTSNHRRCGERPSTASTPSSCCSSSGIRGTTSASSGMRASSRDQAARPFPTTSRRPSGTRPRSTCSASLGARTAARTRIHLMSSARTAAARIRASRSSRSAGAAPCARGRSCASRSFPASTTTCPFVLVDVELTEQPDLRLIGRLLDGPDAPLAVGDRGRGRVRATSRRASRSPHSCSRRRWATGSRPATRWPSSATHRARSQRHASTSLGALAVDTARAAIADAGLALEQVDGFVSAVAVPDRGRPRRRGRRQHGLGELAGAAPRRQPAVRRRLRGHRAAPRLGRRWP